MRLQDYPAYAAWKALREGKTVEFIADIHERVQVKYIGLDRGDKWILIWVHPRFDSPQLQRVEQDQEFFIS